MSLIACVGIFAALHALGASAQYFIQKPELAYVRKLFKPLAMLRKIVLHCEIQV